MSLGLLRCMPMVCMACLLYCVGMTSFTVASDFDERLQKYNSAIQDYIYWRETLYENGRLVIGVTESIKDTGYSFWKDNSTCALGGRSGGFRNDNGGFVYINGADVPQDAISFGGVFDVMSELEMAVFRGMCHYRLCVYFSCTLTFYI